MWDDVRVMLALIDESTPESALGVHYVIAAAVLIDPSQRDEVRERAKKVIGGRQRSFHWRNEGANSRMAMINLLAELEAGVFVVIHRPVSRTRQEAARQTALSALAATLSREGVAHLMVESRGRQDHHDRKTLLKAIEVGVCPPDLRYAFTPKQDALMWLADAAAGVFSEAECRKTERWVAELQRSVALIEVLRLDAHEPRGPS